MQRRKQGEKDGDACSDGTRKAEDANIEIERDDAGAVRDGWREHFKEGKHADAEKHLSEYEPEPCSEDGDEEAFGQQLTHDAAAAGADGEANADLAVPGVGPRQHDVRRVGARCQEDEAEGSEHRGQERVSAR